METVSPDHPQLPLLFAIDGDPSDEDTDAMGDVVDELAASRTWTIAPPEFVNEEDDSSDDPEDAPIVTVGGVVQLYSAFPPWGERLPLSVRRAQYDEVFAIVERMKDFSRTRGVDIVFEYAGESIGDIEGGVADKMLAVGLLGEWDRELRKLGG